MLAFNAAFLCFALAIDCAVGWPKVAFTLLGHPVVVIGRGIVGAERLWNHAQDPVWRQKLLGAATALFVIASAAIIGHIAQSCLPSGWIGVLCASILAWPWIAARALSDHVGAVASPLAQGDVANARIEIAKIVGRDPAALDGAAIARAALESLSENTSDGVVAPLFWGLCFGLPGLFGYKAVNTLDSMIAHRTPQYENFGWFAAHVDDIANWFPARLTGVLYALAAASVPALKIMTRDAKKHRSPNAGWPEAAMAGALGVRLSGPRVYCGHVASEPWLNADGREPGAADLARGLKLFWRVTALCGVILAVFGVCS